MCNCFCSSNESSFDYYIHLLTCKTISLLQALMIWLEKWTIHDTESTELRLRSDRKGRFAWVETFSNHKNDKIDIVLITYKIMVLWS